MTQVEAIVQRYYGDRPVIQRIDDALRAAGIDPERPSHRDLWPFDQLHPPLGSGQRQFGATSVL